MKLIIILLSFVFSNYALAVDLTNQQQINLLNKIGYGVTEGDLAHLKKITYEDWLNEQLNVLDNDYEIDKEIEERFKFPQGKEDFFNFYKNNDFYYNFIFLKKEIDDIHESIINKELKKRVVYGLSSKYRVREMMVWFWYNHFNTGVYLNTTPSIFLDNYENNLRKMSFDSFKNLLTMVSHHPSMLVYLNNTENQKENNSTGLNENYAREFLELHTMGVDSGYTQKDVQELAKILSGHSVLRFIDSNNEPDKIKNYEDLKKHEEQNCDYSLVVDYNIFCSNKHFTKNKFFLGKIIEDNNEKEINEVIDIIVKRKETAQFISKKLAIYFISDNPSQEIINKMSETFLKNDSSIKETLKTMFLSQEFIDSLNKPVKIKDTYTYILSTLKTGINKNFWDDNELMRDLTYFLKDIEASPYVKNTPEGFSIYGIDYMSSGRLQEYLFFTDMTFQKYLLVKKYGINYNLLNKISSSNIKTEKEVTLFFNSEYWLKR